MFFKYKIVKFQKTAPCIQSNPFGDPNKKWETHDVFILKRTFLGITTQYYNKNKLESLRWQSYLSDSCTIYSLAECENYLRWERRDFEDV